MESKHMETTLVELGLSRNESRVYLSLVERGSGTMTQIAHASGIHRVNVYDSIRKLKEKGLVGHISHEGGKQYQAAPPEILRNLIKQKEMKLDHLIPQLALSNKLSGVGHQVQVYQGWDFLRNMFLHFLEVKEDICALNVPPFVIEKVSDHFQNVIHKRRAEQGQKMYHIYMKEAVERIKFLNTLPFTEARYLEEECKEHPVTTTICGDEVAIQIFKEEKDSRPIIILIKDAHVAGAYRQHFFTIWKLAHKP